MAESQPDLPNCASPRNVPEEAYCSGDSVTFSTNPTRAARVKSVIDRINARGGICTRIAWALTIAFNAGRIHVYSDMDDRFRGFTATAPQYGNSRGTQWIAVSNGWLDTFYDAAHTTTSSTDPYGPRNLDQILAHEGEHLLGANHISGDPAKTPNSQACSGLP